MAARVTIQDIADALGLSRNTVSKAINNTGVIADSTRNAVLQKAAEMGYKQFSYFMPNAAAGLQGLVPELAGGVRGEIAVLTTGRMDSSHFASVMVDKVCHEFSELHCTVSIHMILPQDIAMRRLPGNIDRDRVLGIICTEVLDEEYCRMLVSTGIPLLLVDGPLFLHGEKPDVDVLLMDNDRCIYNFIREMKSRGFTKIGFFGPYQHCLSFNERYRSYRLALDNLGLPFSKDHCVLEKLEENGRDDRERYYARIRGRVQAMPEIPEIFICANDFIAIDLIEACRGLLRVPEDVLVLGFDDSSESRLFTPSLSSVHIHSQVMGQYAVGILYRRICHPEIYHVTLHVATDLVIRASTQRPG